MPVSHLDNPRAGCSLAGIEGVRLFEETEKHILHQVVGFSGIAQDAEADS
jgi:hypothetical protein